MKRIFLIIAILFVFIASQSFATDSCTHRKTKNGSYAVYVWTWQTDDGTFNLSDSNNSIAIWGVILAVHFDPGASQQPDSDHNIYLYDSRYNFDWLFGAGVSLDGTSRTASANYQTPLTADSMYPVLYGVKLRPYCSGVGTGTVNGTIYLLVKEERDVP